jgi:hypothetical protein
MLTEILSSLKYASPVILVINDPSTIIAMEEVLPEHVSSSLEQAMKETHKNVNK